ncbi:hypothetical protein P5E54_09825 [Clostridium perfringens]|uniref:hypothetical protein n=1 Tax=Clostridium perfringens TaxID=1502 RepID=UPI001A27C74A|nr:hypothetical protein [Clostridium perfringens]ELC8370840.1 hypothetical protein [Clostridium perfringens]MBO3395188.1 hypothetical protein [Clostridium perfringens]MBO3401768.1 hypothetical protein [Clostridium perfringens]MDH2462658.1 hypothetical protein [Clostridium perfringens]MDH5067285.1 hypothetical protein [Clostridium perfringens]
MATNSLHLIRFEPQENFSLERLIELLFLDDDGEEKFILNEVFDSIIEGYYINYYNSKEIVFNNDINSLETIIVRKSSVIPFSIDIKNNIIDIWGGKNNVIRIINKIGILLNHKVILEYININLEKIALNLNDESIKIGKIKIDNYLLEKDIIAQCTFDLRNHCNSKDIVKKYSKDLIQLSLNISKSGEDILTMIIYRSGSIVIYKSKDEISQDTLDLIKKLVLCRGD